MKKISIYTKTGERAATTYYRIYQYIRRIDNEYRFRKMLPDNLYLNIMPISSKGILTKVCVQIYITVRVCLQLIKDLLDRPDILILSRRFVNRIFPKPYKWILSRLKNKGTKIIWDFDDQIIVSKEVSVSGFNFMSKIADKIVVASEANKNMVSENYHDKTIILPTTDGDMFLQLNENVYDKRKELFDKEIRLIWVGTSSSLSYIAQICTHLDRLAFDIKSQYNKSVILTIVCDKPLKKHSFQNLKLRNIKWDRHVAIKEMLESHIGLMPLENTEFTRAKGGFKLIQYLSVGLPIVGNPVGINKQILSYDVGIAIPSIESETWIDGIKTLVLNISIWKKFSKSSFSKWQTNYSYNRNLEVWQSLLSIR